MEYLCRQMAIYIPRLSECMSLLYASTAFRSLGIVDINPLRTPISHYSGILT